MLNSKIMRLYYICNFTNRSVLTVNISKTYLDKLPIKAIDLKSPAEKKVHDDLVTLVDAMLGLNKEIQNSKGSERELIQRQIEKTDREIDEIVYKLYNITNEEKKIIEGNF